MIQYYLLVLFYHQIYCRRAKFLASPFPLIDTLHGMMENTWGGGGGGGLVVNFVEHTSKQKETLSYIF